VKRVLLVVVLAAGCTRSPEERKKTYVETLQKELQDASSSYALFATLKQGLGALDTPQCPAETKFPRLRLSMAHLELLNGAPHQDGVLVVDLPCPDGFDNVRGFPPRLVEPRDVSEAELATVVKELRAAHLALKNADGFLVQRVDSVVAPSLRAQGFLPAVITGRVVVFDSNGKPQCQVPFEATGASDAGVEVARHELDLQLRREFSVFGVP
jgi:hypothetical protein